MTKMYAVYEDQQNKALNIRKAPNGELTGETVESGSEFEVFSVDHGWCEIEGGWVNASFVKVELRHDCETAGCEDDDSLENMTVLELKKLAEERGLEVKAKATKAELIATIEGDE